MSVIDVEILESKIISLLAGHFLTVQQKIGRDLQLVADLGADSVDIVEVVAALEVVFNVELSLGQVARWRSVNDIVESVVSATG